MPQRTIRLPEATKKQIEDAAGRGGFSSPTAFIRYAIQQQLAAGASQNDNSSEERLTANLEQRLPELERYDRLLKTVGKALAGDAQAAMQELTAHVEQ